MKKVPTSSSFDRLQQRYINLRADGLNSKQISQINIFEREAEKRGARMGVEKGVHAALKAKIPIQLFSKDDTDNWCYMGKPIEIEDKRKKQRIPLKDSKTVYANAFDIALSTHNEMTKETTCEEIALELHTRMKNYKRPATDRELQKQMNRLIVSNLNGIWRHARVNGRKIRNLIPGTKQQIIEQFGSTIKINQEVN